jgi:hypothetical protein
MISGVGPGRGGVAVALLIVLLGVPWPVLAQGPPAGSAPAASAPTWKPEELDQVVAPVALYPDPLLAQVLMASTYPLEVVNAARWLRENPNLKGPQLDEALKKQTWDDSVKSLVSFPPVLNMMNDKLDWTQKLGDAFLAQEKDVMDAVQRLRAKAQAEGNLKSTNEQTVATEQVAAAPPPASPAPPAAPATQPQTTVITIQPTNPQVVYVPTYNPTVVYGTWPYPAYPPYSYYPPGYGLATAAISFGVGMAVGGALWGGCNWGHGDVDVNVNKYNNFTKNVNNANLQNRISSKSGSGGQWQHDPEHRKGVQYRDQGTQQRYGRAEGGGGAQTREQFRGRADQGRQELDRGAADQFRQGGAGEQRERGSGGPGDRPGGGGLGDQRGAGGQGRGGEGLAGRGGAGERPGGGGLGDQRGGLGDQRGGLGDQRGGGTQRASGSIGSGGGQRGGNAFQGVGSGGQTRDYSNRGHSSLNQARGGGGRSGAAGAGARGGGGGGARGGGGGGRRR